MWLNCESIVIYCSQKLNRNYGLNLFCPIVWVRSNRSRKYSRYPCAWFAYAKWAKLITREHIITGYKLLFMYIVRRILIERERTTGIFEIDSQRARLVAYKNTIPRSRISLSKRTRFAFVCSTYLRAPCIFVWMQNRILHPEYHGLYDFFLQVLLHHSEVVKIVFQKGMLCL